jgi:UDP-N-acetylmuramate dehydrogenase
VTLDDLAGALSHMVPPARVQRDAPLAPFSTFRLGGPADLLVTVSTADEALAVIRAAHRARQPLTVLGGGSNVLIADAGVRGVVLRWHGGTVQHDTPTSVQAEAGVTMNGLVRWLVGRGLSGLEAWAGTPGTVGGAIHGNAHFQGRLISESVIEVRVADRTGKVADVPREAMSFAYDYSRLHESGDVVLSARFVVGVGHADALRATARASLAFRKATQPLHLPSAGCIFQNPREDDTMPAGVPRSAGALLDRAGLKGTRLGGASVSDVHANFIVAAPGATASDVRTLIERCRTVVAGRFGVTLHKEVVYFGDWAQAAAQARPRRT